MTYEQFYQICYLENNTFDIDQIYNMYLTTDRWADLRSCALQRDNNRCRMCNKQAECVHHRCYPDKFGTETLDDLTSLCNQCHSNFHFPPSILEVKEQFKNSLITGKGSKCPVCERFTKKYKRKLNSGMASFLISIYKRSNRENVEWFHATKSFFDATGQEYSKLRYWGLLEQKAKTPYWRITDAGKQFVEGKITVKKHINLLDGEFYGFSDEEVSIKDVLGDNFNYQELMNS